MNWMIKTGTDKNKPGRLAYAIAVAVLILAALGCCFPVDDEPDVVEPYEGPKERRQSNDDSWLRNDEIDVYLYGDHAYRNMLSLAAEFDPDSRRFPCHGEGWHKVSTLDLSNEETKALYETWECKAPLYGVPFKLQGAKPDMYVRTFNGYSDAFFFEAQEETVLDAKNRRQRLLNFRLRSPDCEQYNESPLIYRCFQVFSHVRREGKTVILIHARAPFLLHAVLKRIYDHDEEPPRLTREEQQQLLRCGPLKLDCPKVD